MCTGLLLLNTFNAGVSHGYALGYKRNMVDPNQWTPTFFVENINAVM